MKIRQGFVSNSSSSSFLLAIRDDVTFEQVASQCGPFSWLAKELVDKCQSLAVYTGGKQTYTELMERARLEYGYANYTMEIFLEDEAWLSDWALELSSGEKNGWSYYHGYASYNEGDGIEMMIGNRSGEILKLDGFALESRM